MQCLGLFAWTIVAGKEVPSLESESAEQRAARGRCLRQSTCLSLVGFACEWTAASMRPVNCKRRGSVALLQLCAPEGQKGAGDPIDWRQVSAAAQCKVHLFHLVQMHGVTLPQNDELPGQLPRHLNRLLTSRSLLFVRVTVASIAAPLLLALSMPCAIERSIGRLKTE